MWSIRNNMEDIGRWRGEGSWGKSEAETNHERLWPLRNKLEGRRVGVGWAWWWVLRRAHIAWSTECGA